MYVPLDIFSTLNRNRYLANLRTRPELAIHVHMHVTGVRHNGLKNSFINTSGFPITLTPVKKTFQGNNRTDSKI